MFVKRICASLVAASFIVVPVQRAQADEGAALLGGLIVGGLIGNEIAKNKRRTTVRNQAYSASRAQNREVQTALNYFGYNVGSADGVLGRRSRAGISQFQAQMGFAPDGYLEPYERDFLVGSYQRALASSHVPPYNQVMATQGPSGLLRTYRNEQLGINTAATAPQPVQPIQPIPQAQPQIPNTTVVAAPAPVPAPAPAPAPTPTVTARADNATLPSFTFGQTNRSMNEHCNQINVLTAANGGITAPGQVVDAEMALNEQFCLARTHAMSESTKITATIPNMTDAQIEQQCRGLAQVIAPKIDMLPSGRPDQVISEASATLQGSGQPIAQLVSGGKVCLGVGYRIDDAQMALASAILLSGAGELGYGEAVSHHLREGFGTAQTPAQASDWMSMALDRVSSTPGSAVMGQSPDRIAVLQTAMGGGGASAALPVFPSNN